MNNLAKPTQNQIEWANYEIGVIIHLDLQVFEPTYRFRKQWGYHPQASIFNPIELDTDQWIKIAKKAGAKYAVLVVKHCSGFCLWPSKVYDYTIKESPYKEGKGDIFREFIASCKKFDIQPGVYYSTVFNAHERYDQPKNITPDVKSEEFRKYCSLVESQLIELWSEYGELFEIWFDGGHIPNGPNILGLLKKYQPKAVCLQGPKEWYSNLRWVGNESGRAPIPCWSTIQDYGHYDGTKEIKDINKGDPEGKSWMPAETDTSNRFLQWFWYKNQDKLVKSVDELVRIYYTSVGRNTNLLLGMVIDNRGLVPNKDAEVFEKFGEEIKTRFESPIAETHGRTKNLVLDLPNPCIINQITLMEDISEGHLIRKFKVEGLVKTEWITLCEGSCIGHKAILMIKPIEVSGLKLKCVNTIQIPNIKKFAIYNVNPMPKNLSFIKKIARWIYLLKNLKTINM